MIKKLLLFLSFTICITTSAVSDSLIAPPILRIFIHPEILKYGISHYIDEQYAEVATDTYQNLMWDDGSVTNNDLNAVCKAGHLENDKCSEFKRFIVGGFHESCGKTKGQPNDNCIDDVFYSALTGTRVTMLQADGLAKEYARVRHNQDIFCSTNFRTHNLGDFVKCRTADGQNYYEFKFNSVEESADLAIDTNMNAAICKIHGVDYKAAHIKVGGEHVGNQCVTSDEKVCSNINKSAAKFALKTSMQDGICVIQNKHNLTMSNLRTAFGIDNKAFIKGYQLSAYAGMRDQLCDYVKANATTQITTCECEYGISRITDYSNALTMISQREDVLTCYANGEPIDFVFDDLNEGNKKIQKGGLEAFNCAIVGGTYQGQECFVPDENLCRKIAAATIKDCPECKKAYFDTVRNACVLPNAKIANDHQKKVNTGLIIGGTVVGAVITFVSGGTLGGVSMVLIETIGGTMELGAQIHIDGIADEFFEKANSCNKATCAEEILKEFFQYLSRMPNDLQDGEKLGVDAQMERLITLLPDDSQFLTDMVAACYEPGDDNFDISRCDDGTWNADQVIRAAGIALQFTSVFVSVGKWVLGANRIRKITEKAPRLTQALQRKIPGVKSTLAKKLSSGEKVVRSDGKAVNTVFHNMSNSADITTVASLPKSEERIGVLVEIGLKESDVPDIIRNLEKDGFRVEVTEDDIIPGKKIYYIFADNESDIEKAQKKLLETASSTTDRNARLAAVGQYYNPRSTFGYNEYKNSVTELLLNDPDIETTYKNWENMSEYEKWQFEHRTNRKIRRQLINKDAMPVAYGRVTDPRAKASYGPQRIGSEAEQTAKMLDGYDKYAVNPGKDTFFDAIESLTHENYHYKQDMGGTEIPKWLLDFNVDNYSIEQEGLGGFYGTYQQQPVEVGVKKLGTDVAHTVEEELKLRQQREKILNNPFLNGKSTSAAQASTTQQKVPQISDNPFLTKKTTKSTSTTQTIKNNLTEDGLRGVISGQNKSVANQTKLSTAPTHSWAEIHQAEEEAGRLRIDEFHKKYDLSIEGRKKYTRDQWNKILDSELKYSDIEEEFRKDFKQGMNEFYYNNTGI